MLPVSKLAAISDAPATAKTSQDPVAMPTIPANATDPTT